MSLALIEKYTLSKEHKKPTIKIKYIVTEQERTLLVKLFILDDLLMREEKKQILTFCRSVHERDLWIQCDCVAGLSKPVFRFNRASSGTLYLHHITSRGDHAEGCAFKERIWTTSELLNQQEKPRLKETTPLNLVSKKSVDALPKNNNEPLRESTSSTGSRRSKLCRGLYRLLDDAGVNVINPQTKIVPIKAIELAASAIEIQPKKRMLDYLYTNPSLLFKAAYALRDDTTPWQNGIRKHALMLVKAHSFDEQIIEAFLPNGTTQKIKISNRIYCSSGRFGSRTAPFMALILITDSAEKPNFFEPFNAFIVPCYSEKTFIPVDSHYEREVLRRLFALQFERTKQGCHLEIIKPLFDIKVSPGTPEETGVLPDFILKTRNKQLIIEINGSHEPEYLQRKNRVHQSMGELGLVLSLDAYGAEKENRFNQSMTQFIAQIKSHLD
ncbi:TPA: hypothetical protein ACPSKF_000640 [Legionella anisa]